MRCGGSARPQQLAAALRRAPAARRWLASSLASASSALRCARSQVAGALAAHVALELRPCGRPLRRQRVLDQLAVRDRRGRARSRAAAAARRSTATTNAASTSSGAVGAVGAREEARACPGSAVAEAPAAARRPRRRCIAQASTSRSAARPSTYWRACSLRMRGDQVAQARGLLEIQARAGRFHRRAQFARSARRCARRGTARRGAPLARSRARVHQPDAGRAAAADLVLQAGPRAVAEHAVLAAAQLEQLVHQVERLAHRAGARDTGRSSARAWRAGRDGRRCAATVSCGEQHVGIALVVAQQHVVARLAAT